MSCELLGEPGLAIVVSEIGIILSVRYMFGLDATFVHIIVVSKIGIFICILFIIYG